MNMAGAADATAPCEVVVGLAGGARVARHRTHTPTRAHALALQKFRKPEANCGTIAWGGPLGVGRASRLWMPSRKDDAMSSSDELLAAAWTGAVQGAIACASPRASEPTPDASDELERHAHDDPHREVRELRTRGRVCS